MITAIPVRIGIGFALVFLLLFATNRPLRAQQVKYEAAHSVEEPVSFRTEDGWTIHGTLTKPTALAEHRPVAAVLLLHSSSHDQDIFSRSSYPGFGRMQNHFVTLRIDIRGRGK